MVQSRALVLRVWVEVVVSVFPDELYQAPRSWAERAHSFSITAQDLASKS